MSNDVTWCVAVHVTMAMTAGTTTSFPMSNHTRERVTVAKLTLENFYSNLIIQHEERETRYCSAPSLPSAAALAVSSRALQSPGMGQLWEVLLYVVAGSEFLEGTGCLWGGSVNIPSDQGASLLMFSCNLPPHHLH